MSLVRILDYLLITPLQITYAVESSRLQTILNWKFDHYDNDHNGELNQAALYIFRNEIFRFVKCKDFFDQLRDLIDSNEDGSITRSEWQALFSEPGEQRINFNTNTN